MTRKKILIRVIFSEKLSEKLSNNHERQFPTKEEADKAIKEWCRSSRYSARIHK